MTTAPRSPKINEAQRILDLAKKSRPAPAAGPSAPPAIPAGKPSPSK